MKPPILSDRQIQEWSDTHVGEALLLDIVGNGQVAQRDADVAYYEPLIQQAKRESYDEGYANAVKGNQEIIGKREVFWQKEVQQARQGGRDSTIDRSNQLLKEIEKLGWHGKSAWPCHEHPYFGILEDNWQSLKSKYRGKKK